MIKDRFRQGYTTVAFEFKIKSCGLFKLMWCFMLFTTDTFDFSKQTILSIDYLTMSYKKIKSRLTLR